MFKKAKVIIGVHGLGNKPPQPLLQEWWKQALLEGLRRAGQPAEDLPFELVYWADILYLNPQNPAITDPDHPLYIDNPYQPAPVTPPEPPGEIRIKVLDWLVKELKEIILNEDQSFNVDNLTDKLVKRFFTDLDSYYGVSHVDREGQTYEVKQRIRARLEEVLRRHRRKDILLIGHSMGSIVAYDVMKLTAPEAPVHTWVTIGSPLGIPVVLKKAAAEQSSQGIKVFKISAPDSLLRQWHNLSDLRDKIAINYNLRDDVGANRRGVAPIDYQITNDYEYRGEKNPHSLIGYLRCPEMARIVGEFLADQSSSPVRRVMDKINGWLGKR